jgi:hypothetical protein
VYTSHTQFFSVIRPQQTAWQHNDQYDQIVARTIRGHLGQKVLSTVPPCPSQVAHRIQPVQDECRAGMHVRLSLQWPVLARSRELHPCGLVLCPTFLWLFLGRHVLPSGVPCNVTLAGITAHKLSPASQGRHLCAQAKQGTTSIGLPCMRSLTIFWATLLKVAMSSADDNSSEPFKSRNSQLTKRIQSIQIGPKMTTADYG